MSRADAYLTIPPDYAADLGWRWALRGDAVEDADGNTVVLTDELAQVLEGAWATATPHIAHVLHLVALTRGGAVSAPAGPARLLTLREACLKAKPLRRNIGVLIAELCRGLDASFPDPPTWADLDLALKRRQLSGERHRPNLAVVPALGPVEFGHAVGRRLAGLDALTLAHWLKHGCGPDASGAKLADEAAVLPWRAGGLLDVLRERDRLVGAATLAPALDAALTLPPRRPRPDRLPQGGYADVTNRGDPDRLLPSQFALEGDEFVRRFAERELLYFRREEPHRPTAPDRWLVLDQGVRTWGPVRLGLTAGVVALLGKDASRFGRPRLFVTSHAEPLDPTELAPEALATHLEASDLSASPGDALTTVFDQPTTPADPPRDVIVFTHPRSLGAGDVRGAVRLRGANDRLFTVTVDEEGRAELGEWTAAGRVTLRTFRVDLVGAEAARVSRPAPAVAAAVGGWSGDAEPVPFPFRAGLVTDIEHVAFDAAADRAAVAGRGGAVTAVELAGGSVEVLPRAYRHGQLLTRVEAVVGVAGGVVVCGRMGWPRSAGSSGEVLAAAHYDFATRAVRLHPMGEMATSSMWWSFPDLHCVVVRAGVNAAGLERGSACDLDTGGRFPPDPTFPTAGLVSRARTAWDRAATEPPNPTDLPAYTVGTFVPPLRPYLEHVGGRLVLQHGGRAWTAVGAYSQGRPITDGRTLAKGALGGDVLAVVLRDGKRAGDLFVVRGPDKVVLGEHRVVSLSHVFALSRDGGRLARQTGGRSLEVRDTVPGGSVLAAVHSGRFHTRLDVQLTADRLAVRIGHDNHMFSLGGGSFWHASDARFVGSPAMTTRAGAAGLAVSYDPARFTDPIAAGPWVAAFDKWGQVVLMTRSGRLVMTVAVRRELAAAWLPDGTRWGSAALLGGPPHPAAAEQIGAALSAAGEG